MRLVAADAMLDRVILGVHVEGGVAETDDERVVRYLLRLGFVEQRRRKRARRDDSGDEVSRA